MQKAPNGRLLLPVSKFSKFVVYFAHKPRLKSAKIVVFPPGSACLSK